MTKHKHAGPWELVRVLGGGGNAVVYVGIAEGGLERAVKVPKNQKPGSDAVRRFVDEVAALRALRDRPGVLSLLDSNANVRDGLLYHVSPLGQPIQDCCGPDDLEHAVGAVASIAETLSELAEDGFFHRDLKPSNLLRVDGVWVVADFGLVTFPGKAAVTTDDRRLGPLYYIAPEMLNTPSQAAPGPADVYSLAKTLWVLCTGQRFPIPGNHDVDAELAQVGTFVSHPRSSGLDELLHTATRLEPDKRPTMEQISGQLRDWLEPVGTREISISRPAEVMARLTRLAKPIESRRREQARLKVRASDICTRLEPPLTGVRDALSRAVPYESSLGGGFGIGRSVGSPANVWATCRKAVQFKAVKDPQKGPAPIGVVEITAHLTDNDRALLEATIRVERGNDRSTVFTCSDEAATAQESLAHALDRIQAQLTLQLDPLLQEFTRAVEEYMAG